MAWSALAWDTCCSCLSRKKYHERYVKKKIDISKIQGLKALLKKNRLNTVCVSARCPNKSECFGKKTATFLILGEVCTRGCLFCSVKKNTSPGILDAHEPERIAGFVHDLGLEYVVITSVTRDDLPDGGASQFFRTIQAVRVVNPDAIIEVLTPDFQLNYQALDAVLEAQPDVFNHNVETVPRLYPVVRPEANYQRSLKVLEYSKQKSNKLISKTGLMLGLGENRKEVEEAMRDLRKVNCDVLILGQYFQPTKQNIPVTRYLTREEFKEYEQLAQDMGFLSVVASPSMRSSYLAKELYKKMTNDKIQSTK
ncbi:MAG: lipoyl synthase [Elusimicrobia bacterium]|nr:lipoyl synthase [Elusimicrobiota bacterium]